MPLDFCFGSMESVDCREPGASPFLPLVANAAMHLHLSGSAVGGESDASSQTEWQSIPLEDPSRADRETEYSFHLTERKQSSSQQARKLELSPYRLSKFVGGDANVETEALTTTRYPSGSKKDGSAEMLMMRPEQSDALGGVKEMRLPFHDLEDSSNGSKKAVHKKSSGSALEYGDEGCLPLLHTLRAFIKSAKFSCTGLFFGDSRTSSMFDRCGYLLQRSFSFSSSDNESLSKKSTITGSPLTRSASAPSPMTSPILSSGTPDKLNAGPLQARDLQYRAEALPLAHYRPIETALWKEGEVTSGPNSPSVNACSSPGHINCKKPPRPPRHPGRSVSIDGASLSAQRSARKSRERRLKPTESNAGQIRGYIQSKEQLKFDNVAGDLVKGLIR